jgi:hypothetical protein
MRGVAGTSPDPIVRGAAEARAQEAPAATGALPKSLVRLLEEMGEDAAPLQMAMNEGTHAA